MTHSTRVLLVEIVFLFGIFFAIWLIFKTWSRKYPREHSEKIKRIPPYFRWLYLGDTNRFIISARIYSIVLLVVLIVLEVLLIVKN
jgi:hypothetical protein